MIAALLLRLGIPKWGAIAFLAVALAVGAVTYRDHLIHMGVQQEAARRDAQEAAVALAAQSERNRLNTLVATARAQLADAIAHLEILEADLDHEKATSSALQSDLAVGRRRLRVLTAARAPDPSGHADGATAASVDPGAPVEADLDPAAAGRVVGLTSEGDQAIIRLNACVAAYDAVMAAADQVQAGQAK